MVAEVGERLRASAHTVFIGRVVGVGTPTSRR
ncbi:hypothetical protein [Marinactinospora rubrisoli]|uniref:Uncharacterized protein n=1 Tax=Marinactinospora rubrisoli TaxID=2715399 RepID=A0ABW2KMW8_9ACTN